MKKTIAKLRKKFLEKLVLFLSSKIFLKAAFEEAIENNHKPLVDALAQFREQMPDNLKNLKNKNDYEQYFFNFQFIELVSNIELFFVEAITLVVSKYPNKIGKQQILIQDLVELKNEELIINKACSEYLNKLTYKKPADYKSELFSLLSAKENMLDKEWLKYIEMKARRDIGIHNDWIINDVYKTKTKECDITLNDNVTYLYPVEEYLDECYEVSKIIFDKICNHIEEKYS